MNKARTYANSYLYTKIPDYERNILEFVMSAERIDKNSEAFYGVVEDVKRRQTSAVLSRVLTRDDVILCVGNKPLPASFKVFACKDVKTDQKVKVFIDLTGLITIKNGFYNISKIDIFCSYLLSAMTNIIYNEDTTKLMSNSTIIQSATECFVNLSTHIFDYLRVNGFSENKNKIAYILAIYFQSTVLGLDRTDGSVKNLAAKLSTIPGRDINAMEIYFDDEDLINIDTVINCLVNTFKMKGVGTDIFIEKWTWFYGVGTQFATELFPAFATMLSDAYCGAYINNQKTIEKCCGRAMVNFTTTLLRVGGDLIDRGYKYESTLDRDIDRRTKSLLEAENDAKGVMSANRLTDSDISKVNNAIKKYGNLKKGWAPSQKNPKNSISSMGQSWLGTIMATASYYVYPKSAPVQFNKNKDSSGWGSQASSFAKVISKDLTSKDKDTLVKRLESNIRKLEKDIASNSPFNSNTDKKEAQKVLKDFKATLKILDSGNPMIKESDNMLEKETNQMMLESFDEIDRVTNTFLHSMNTDKGILEAYLTEGIIDSFIKAIESIFEGIKNFFKSLFGKATDDLEEKSKDNKSNIGSKWNISITDVEKTFKENYKNVKVEKAIDTNYVKNNLVPILNNIEDKIGKDIDVIKVDDIGNVYNAKEEDLDTLKNKGEDALKTAENDMKSLIQELKFENIFVKKNNADSIDEKVLDTWYGNNIKADMNVQQNEINKVSANIQKTIAATKAVNSTYINFVPDEGESEDQNKSLNDITNKAKNIVCEYRIKMCQSYAKHIERLGSMLVIWYTKYQIECHNEINKVIDWAKDNGKLSTKNV